MKHFHLSTYKEGDEKEIVEFLSKVFEFNYPLDLWYWKYKEHGLGTYEAIARVNNKIIGHFGGLPKRLYYKGKYSLSALICDVAVDPKYRGIFSKKGVFYNLFHKFKEEYVSENLENRVFLLGYGFPTKIARILALRLGLYEDVENVLEVKFYKSISLLKGFLYSVRDLAEKYDLVNKLWQNMFSSLRFIYGKDFVVNIRDKEYIQWRVKQPNAKFKIKVVYRLFKPLAVFVIRVDKDEPILYDYIGNLKDFSTCMQALIIQENFPYIKARFAPWMESYFKNLKYEKIPTDTFLVANKVTGPRAYEIQGRFFYTFGDEDV